MASSHVTKCPLFVTYGLCFSCRTMGMGCENTELACELATVAFEGEVDNINVPEGQEVFDNSAQTAARLDPRVKPPTKLSPTLEKLARISTASLSWQSSCLNKVSRLSPTSLTFNTISISTIPLQGAQVCPGFCSSQ